MIWLPTLQPIPKHRSQKQTLNTEESTGQQPGIRLATSTHSRQTQRLPTSITRNHLLLNAANAIVFTLVHRRKWETMKRKNCRALQ